MLTCFHVNPLILVHWRINMRYLLDGLSHNISFRSNNINTRSGSAFSAYSIAICTYDFCGYGHESNQALLISQGIIECNRDRLLLSNHTKWFRIKWRRTNRKFLRLRRTQWKCLRSQATESQTDRPIRSTSPPFFLLYSMFVENRMSRLLPYPPFSPCRELRIVIVFL